VIEHLPSIQEALGSIPSIGEKKKSKVKMKKCLQFVSGIRYLRLVLKMGILQVKFKSMHAMSEAAFKIAIILLARIEKLRYSSIIQKLVYDSAKKLLMSLVNE
jgi:hypothetical protein